MEIKNDKFDFKNLIFVFDICVSQKVHFIRSMKWTSKLTNSIISASSWFLDKS